MVKIKIEDYGTVSNKELAKHLGISENALRIRASRLGLTSSGWSDSEVEYLLTNKSKKSYAEIAKALGKTKDAVKLKFSRINNSIPEKVHIIDLSTTRPEIIKGKYNITYLEYLEKKSLIESMCSPKRKIPARKTTVVDVSPSVFQKFLQENHLEGRAGATWKIGLSYQGELVSVAGFMIINGEFTLVRFCSLKGVTVVGGLSKLLARFRDRDIVTFSDYRYSLGDVYEKVGFIKVKENAERLYFTDGKMLYNRRGFQKKNQEKKFDNFNWGLTERENAEANGFHQVFLGGTVKWILPKIVFS